jgi:hypothetical protein
MRKFLILSAVLILAGCTAKPTEVVLQYAGLSLNQLQQSKEGSGVLVFAHEEYKNESWTSKSLPSGKYRLQPSDDIPAVILATALLTDRKNDDLATRADRTHCVEGRDPEGYVGLYWSEEKLYVEKDYCSIQGGGVWEAKE